MTEQERAARGWPSTFRSELMEQTSPGVWVVRPRASEDCAPFDFLGELARLSADLLSRQESLGAEFMAVWDANREALYESEPQSAPQADLALGMMPDIPDERSGPMGHYSGAAGLVEGGGLGMIGSADE